MEHAYLPSALDTPEADLFVPYLKDERRHHIEKMLAASDQGFVRSTILARQFEVSVVTVKRDLLALERAGVARCVRGEQQRCSLQLRLLLSPFCPAGSPPPA